jgi:hypothetical protein
MNGTHRILPNLPLNKTNSGFRFHTNNLTTKGLIAKTSFVYSLLLLFSNINGRGKQHKSYIFINIKLTIKIFSTILGSFLGKEKSRNPNMYLSFHKFQKFFCSKKVNVPSYTEEL